MADISAMVLESILPCRLHYEGRPPHFHETVHAIEAGVVSPCNVSD